MRCTICCTKLVKNCESKKEWKDHEIRLRRIIVQVSFRKCVERYVWGWAWDDRWDGKKSDWFEARWESQGSERDRLA